MLKQMTKQDAIEALEFFRNDYTREGSEICQAIGIAIDTLKQSMVESEQRHGQWMLLPNKTAPSKIFRCSEYGSVSEHKYYSANGYYSFCKDCGADMREVSKDAND